MICAVYNSILWNCNSILWGEIGRQHVKCASGSRYRSILDLTHPPTHSLTHSPTQSKYECERIRRPDHNTGNYVPYACEQCVGSLTSNKVIMNKGCETGPTIYRPYPRRLDSLTICRYHYKGSTFSSVILRP